MGIVVIGAVFVDIKGYPLSTYIPGGRNAGRVEQVHGGVCRNVAEDIANVELRPTFVSLVDDTGIGQDVINKLKAHKVNTKYIRTVPDGMGTWLAVFDNDGDVCAAISKRPDTSPLTRLLEEKGDEIFKDCDSIALELERLEEEAHHHHHDHDDDDHDHDCCHHHDDEDEHEHHHEHHYDEHGVCSCGHHHHHDHDADEVFTSWGRETARKYSREELQEALSALAMGQDYGYILRAKGMVPCDDGQTWLHFDLVPEEFQIREGAADYTGRLCVIGSDLKEDQLEKLFLLA